MMRIRPVVVMILGTALLSAHPVSAADEDRGKTAAQFETVVAPLLQTYCWKCHGGEARTAELDLRSLPLLLRGGKNGPAIVRGSAEKSLLYQKLAGRQMPPGDELKPTDAHIAVVREWIDAGAAAEFESTSVPAEAGVPPMAERDWAFRPPVRPALPAISEGRQTNNAIDSFLNAKLVPAGLEMGAQAEATVQVKRAYLDALGLPPAPHEIDSYLADDSPVAYERLVDRLLGSPQFGERVGRLWLDAAGYVDTSGGDNDAGIIKPRDGIWRYRDWVVRALNDDLPYDRFVTLQLAGDELVDWRHATQFTPEIIDALVATGFLRQAADTTDEPELNTSDIRHQVLYDTIQTVCSNLMGITMHCTQCHDHKFDPFVQRDYYRIAAVFSAAYNVQEWKNPTERFLADVPPEERNSIDTANTELEKKIAAWNGEITKQRELTETRLIEQRYAAIPMEIRDDLRKALAQPAEKRTEVQKYLAENLGARVRVAKDEIDKFFDEPTRRHVNEIQSSISAMQSQKRSYAKIQAAWDVASPPPAFVYRRGDFRMPGEPIQAGVIACMMPERESPTFETLSIPDTSGYRTAFARWLTRADHPLTARVIANRVWQQYFGRALVATSENFGASGSGTLHQELLDYLAIELIRHQWSLKWLHREIMLSHAYRQRSQTSEEQESKARQVDPENQLLWKFPLKRLDSEQIRDRILATSGDLLSRMGGPPLPLKSNPDGMVEIDRDKLPAPHEAYRRSLYVLARRNYQLNELSVFDQPLVAPNCTRRTPSAVVLQPLAMLNSRFVAEQAEHFSQRVRRAAGDDQKAQIHEAFRVALGRPPDSEETTAAAELLRRHSERFASQQSPDGPSSEHAALVQLCQMLLNTNEFLYVE